MCMCNARCEDHSLGYMLEITNAMNWLARNSTQMHMIQLALINPGGHLMAWNVRFYWTFGLHTIQIMLNSRGCMCEQFIHNLKEWGKKRLQITLCRGLAHQVPAYPTMQVVHLLTVVVGSSKSTYTSYFKNNGSREQIREQIVPIFFIYIVQWEKKSRCWI
jgi:hypothetical protein